MKNSRLFENVRVFLVGAVAVAAFVAFVPASAFACGDEPPAQTGVHCGDEDEPPTVR